MRGEGRRDAESDLNLPPGFRFHPTDDELVVHYLCRKAAHQRLPVPIIAEVDLYKFDPWELPEKALFGRREWYFFTPRDRKYPNGSRPNRAAGRGYWKATGADKPVTPPGSARPLAIKKALVFYHGKAPKGIKTDWIMHEYRLADTNRSVAAGKKGGLRLDEWVLCRLYNKKNTWEKMMQQKEMEASLVEKSSSNDVTGSDSVWTPESDIDHSSPDHIDLKPEINHEPQLYSGFQATTQQHQQQQQQQQIVKEDQDWFMDLNLDDLQSSLMGFGSAPRMDLPSSQDYYFPAMPSPQMRPGQGGFPPF